MKIPLTTILTCDNSGIELGKFESALLEYKNGDVVENPINETGALADV